VYPSIFISLLHHGLHKMFLVIEGILEFFEKIDAEIRFSVTVMLNVSVCIHTGARTHAQSHTNTLTQTRKHKRARARAHKTYIHTYIQNLSSGKEMEQ
jgi:hypothetical protein